MSKTELTIPDLALVVLVGASGSGKSTFAANNFKPTEVVSSDDCRGIVADDPTDQLATEDAFAVLHFIAARRLARGNLTVIDATNVRREDRLPLVKLAREADCLPVAIVLNISDKVCAARNKDRPDRQFPQHVVRRHAQLVRRSLRSLKKEGFRRVLVLDDPDQVQEARIIREPLWNDRRHEVGPFDLIGDIHGCFDELKALLEELGYELDRTETDDVPAWNVQPPEGRKVIFLGDLVDRGPKTPEVLRLVMDMVQAGQAFCVAGNHEVKLLRKLRGRDVKVTHGLAESVEQLENESPAFVERATEFIDGLVSHYVLDGGDLVAAHAGLKQSMHGRASGRVREFALYGDTTGETDDYGLPVRYPWAEEYRGQSLVVYGHTPVAEPEWLNRTVNIDTGCVFGGCLTALRYPERDIVSVPADRTWYEPAKPFIPDDQRAPALDVQQQHDELLDLGDLSGKRFVRTGLHRTVTVPEENNAAALEIMSRFGANPKWLIYLPPTMSPCETSQAPGFLERPEEAFQFYRSRGVGRVVCEEKHMGSRAVLVICRDDDVARSRFGIIDTGPGVCTTRTGRSFFRDRDLERALLLRVRKALETAGTWEQLETDWICLDAELMPWSAKAKDLVRSQYAAVGAAANASLPEARRVAEAAKTRGVDVDGLADQLSRREEVAAQYVQAYRRYCWPVSGLEDLKLAPFHILASEKRVHTDRDHCWHMETLAAICAVDPDLLLATPFREVDLVDEGSQAQATAWWEEFTGRGGEGMVVKPIDFIARGKRGLLQPALKVRGKEYLRIIYGPEYTEPANLERLRSRGLSKKRSLALREFALGIEAMDRFVRREPLTRVHECVLGVLALESEPVDPRL
ncbi:MAG: polynucleotide kinase-phosphatase [Deltaproteobacteria bacterium]|nr:polynucleotide kinase-phosphatase [Deltaproteobacteria bacterium]